VFGDISNAATGKIVVSGGAGATFYDDIVQNGTFRVSKVGSTTSVAVVFGAFSGTGGSTGGGDIFFEGDLRPGNSPASVTFENNVSFGSAAGLKIELGGTTLGTQYDQVQVLGQLALDGTLDVLLINGFTPVAGSSFDILNWGSLSGTFSSIVLPTLGAGLTWNTSQLYTAGVLSIGVPGDFNANGTVEASDYLVWRKGLGAIYTQGDYDVWRANFGKAAGSGSAMLLLPAASTGAAVPEPTSIVLCLAGAIIGILFRARLLTFMYKD
jgi:hypothetical protein